MRLVAHDFAEWRDQARTLYGRGILPHEVQWSETEQPGLFGDALSEPAESNRLQISKEFIALAQLIACHRNPQKWTLLYQLLWRVKHGEPHLMKVVTDPLMVALHHMQKAIKRDAHKAKAFMRFRLTEEDGEEHYIAWHQPDHLILPLVAPFFSRRFATMRWTILTPDQSVSWDLERLTYGPGVPADAAPQSDALEDLWRTYYRSTFNPARIKLKMMKSEMPVRYWHTMPETAMIPSMLAEAPERVEQMIKHSEGMTQDASDYIPTDADLNALRAAAQGCRGCELYEEAHHTVFGQGPESARLMLIGEQPGDEEDQRGEPFVGPAGQLLNALLNEVGLERDEIYITNAVKHFRFIYKGSFRQHRSPSPYHIKACKPWLQAELAQVQPEVVVCLGNSAARALTTPGFTMKDKRGQWLSDAPWTMASYHPSAILRSEAYGDTRQRQLLLADLATAKAKLAA